MFKEPYDLNAIFKSMQYSTKLRKTIGITFAVLNRDLWNTAVRNIPRASGAEE